MPRLFGLIGYPLTHSFSPAYFKNKFTDEHVKARYQLFPIPSLNEFPNFLKAHPKLEGLNVTIPYKRSVIPYLDEIDPAANEVNAVNCIDFKDGKKIGYNTDIIGFRESLLPLLQAHHTHALILGTGGSAQAVAYVLKAAGISFLNVSRTKSRGPYAYEDVTRSLISKYKLIINTTPLGMNPDMKSAPPLPYDQLTDQHLLYDLVYNPEETRFLSLGKANGATIKNGLEMLHLQADASWAIWNR